MPMPDIFKATLEESLKESLTGGLIAQAVAKVMGTAAEPAPATAAKLPSTSPVNACARLQRSCCGHAPSIRG